jgi:hypothetical protein
MRNCLWIGLVLATTGCQQKAPSTTDKYGDAAGVAGMGGNSAGYVVPEPSSRLRQRADSLAALDPVLEANAAARRGDLKYLAVCVLSCTLIGTVQDSVCLLDGCLTQRRADVHPIDGMGIPAINAAVARLDTIGTRYGVHYNAVIREFRKRRPTPHQVT